ncbi:MAG: LPS export ABC transporter ATP-binding protein [Candidatus Fraserbacteria bacterium RBG_16_55_9]|uniref:LPS export ABC transporter ATP-binding protein n=1 Tax=Fraserbacteria sp. (strain RBG_16_55_9) TaxID=1817864 RepID=A0A1F5V250_FRAXR|nr:MAG: LPS export ABC transporter ATP-binding protein [Candidatus Fraserbacteria bacterium RBG_16_55_9]
MRLAAETLIKRFGRQPIVDGVSLGVESGHVVGLLGPNGAGKTTTFHLIVGLAAPDAGRITLDGEEITRESFHSEARRGINYLPQEPSVFRKLSVLENLLLVLERQNGSRVDRRNRAEELLIKLNISQLASQRADTLSAGERRRVEIARALASTPRFLLLDEPFTGIDPLSVEGLQEIIFQLKAEGIGIIVTDHNVRETLRVTDYVYLLQGGRIFLEGLPREIEENPLAKKFYLGERFQL